MDGAADSGTTARTFSQHIAGPSIPGLYAFAAAFGGDGTEDLFNIPADREIMGIPGCGAHAREREFVRACGVRS